MYAKTRLLLYMNVFATSEHYRAVVTFGIDLSPKLFKRKSV